MSKSFMKRPRMDSEENLFVNEDGNPTIPLTLNDQVNEASDEDPTPYQRTVKNNRQRNTTHMKRYTDQAPNSVKNKFKKSFMGLSRNKKKYEESLKDELSAFGENLDEE